MKIFRGIESYEDIGAVSLTVGSFDGLHAGHLSLIEELTQSAHGSNRRSVVVSFSPHPRIALSRCEGFKLLASESEREYLLEQAGVDALLLLDFTRELGSLGYKDFIANILLQHISMEEIFVGYDHHLGHDRGGWEQISQLGKELGFAVTLAKEYLFDGEPISSTRLRAVVEQGDMLLAERLLSHPYLVDGSADEQGVISINEPMKLLPPSGRYIALINGVLSEISVKNGVAYCSQQGNVRVEFLEKL